jgi:hypothetical protein
MKICVCDRCGKQRNALIPNQTVKIPMYKIAKLSSLMYPAWEDVDLCSDCEEKFAEWLEGDLNEHKY